MKVQRTISLDEQTAKLAAQKNNLSEWVRARLLAWEEQALDEFAELLVELPTRRLAFMLHAKLRPRGQAANLSDDNLAAAIMAWATREDIKRSQEGQA
jgi:hypothetical protein